jgi:hypothetical protein
MEKQKDKPSMDEVKDMEKFLLSRAIGHIYVHVAKIVIEKFGREGEFAIRKGLREFGKYRGNVLGNGTKRKGFLLILKV